MNKADHEYFKDYIDTRFSEIQKLIQSHAVGVQNVYNELHEMKLKLNINYVNDLIELIKRTDQSAINSKLIEYSTRLNDSKAGEALRLFDEFKTMISDLHNRICY